MQRIIVMAQMWILPGSVCEENCELFLMKKISLNLGNCQSHYFNRGSQPKLGRPNSASNKSLFLWVSPFFFQLEWLELIWLFCHLRWTGPLRRKGSSSSQTKQIICELGLSLIYISIWRGVGRPLCPNFPPCPPLFSLCRCQFCFTH